MDFAVPKGSRVKIKESEKIVLGPCQRTKKAVRQADDGDSNRNWRVWNGLIKFGRKIGETGNQRKNQDQQDQCFARVG